MNPGCLPPEPMPHSPDTELALKNFPFVLLRLPCMCPPLVPLASRWSTTAPSVGTQRSCDRWHLAERCPGHSLPCLCSMCAQASGCPRKWTALRCPSYWTSTEGRPRWVQLGRASLFLGIMWLPSQGCHGGLGNGKGHTGLSALQGSGGKVFSSARGVAPVPNTCSPRGRVGKAGELGPGSHELPLSLLFAAPVPALALSSLLSPLTEQP